MERLFHEIAAAAVPKLAEFKQRVTAWTKEKAFTKAVEKLKTPLAVIQVASFNGVILRRMSET